jgi:hypothetical protein
MLTFTLRWVFILRLTSSSQQVPTSSPIVCDGMPSANVAPFVG